MLSPLEQEVLVKVQRFCSYQERSEWEVRKKLKGLGIDRNREDDFIDDLIEQGYLNEGRFADAFVLGRFRSKGWGRLKIRQGLAEKGVRGSKADEALKAIDPEEYQLRLQELAEAKGRNIKVQNAYERKHKIARFLIGRGFESGLVWEVLGRN